MGARVNDIYTSRNGNSSPPVFVNMTVQLGESPETLRVPVKQDLQKHLMGVIHRRSNNIGSSPLWVDTPNGAISQIHGKHRNCSDLFTHIYIINYSCVSNA